MLFSFIPAIRLNKIFFVGIRWTAWAQICAGDYLHKIGKIRANQTLPARVANGEMK